MKYHRFLLPLLFVACFVLISPSSARADRIEWPIAEDGNGHFYEVIFVSDEISWDEANLSATSRGGYLVTIGSEAENLFVFDLIDESQYWSLGRGERSVGPWLGGFQPTGSTEPDANWQWVTGEPFLYTNWSVDEPNNWQGAENYLSYYSPTPGNIEALWNDIPNFDPPYSPRAYIVEYVPEPSSASDLG